MKLRTKVTLLTVGIAVPAMALGPVLFPAAPGIAPTPTQLALLIPIAVLEGVALGLGVAFLAYGWPLVRAVVGESRRRTMAAYLSCGWLLSNWWLHDNLHITNGSDLNGLIAIDWAFHTTLIAAAAVVAYALLESLREGRLRVGQPRRTASEPTAAQVAA